MQSNPLPTPTQRSGATVAFAITGLLWTVWLAGILDAVTDGHLYLLLWAGSAVVLWFLLLEELRDPKHSATKYSRRVATPASTTWQWPAL